MAGHLIRVCDGCGRERWHHAHGLCSMCYWHWRKLGIPSPTAPRWPAERDEELTRLFIAGLTAKEIGREMSTTRNAVIGRWTRLGLSRSPVLTTLERLDALHDRLDTVLAEIVSLAAAGRLHIKLAKDEARERTAA
jgi:GcrA cell cycle regulator